jgi:ParB family chromosome partitioning protein
MMAEAAKLEERRAEIDEIQEGLAVYSKKDRKRAGCIVTIGDDGEFCLHQGLIERSAMRNAGNGAADHEGFDDADTFDPQMPSDDEDQEFSRPASGAEQALRKELGFSQSLVDDLKAHRLQITRTHLAVDFGVAFDLALYSLCTDMFGHGRGDPLELRAIAAAPRSSLNDLHDTPAEGQLETHRSTLDLDWLSLPPAQAFAALSALPFEAKQRLFAWCIAATLKPQLAIEHRADPVIEAAGRRLSVPFADYWRPTAANYWGRVKKAHSLAVGAEILGERWARDHADDKKAVLAAALEIAFDPVKNDACVSLSQAARDAAAVWMPPGMAYTAEDGPVAPSTADAGIDPVVDTGPADTDLPAFLTADEPAALDGVEVH